MVLDRNSPHWGLKPGPSVYRTDALPLSYRGSGRIRVSQNLGFEGIWVAGKVCHCRRPCPCCRCSQCWSPLGVVGRQAAACGLGGGFRTLAATLPPPHPPSPPLNCEVAAPPRRRASSNFAIWGGKGGWGSGPRLWAGLNEFSGTRSFVQRLSHLEFTLRQLAAWSSGMILA